MSVNVDGGFHLAREFVPSMRRVGWGRVVMVASSSFFAPPAGMTHYIASKGALIGLVRGLAVELGGEGRLSSGTMARGYGWHHHR